MLPITIEEVAMLPIPITVKWQDGTSETFQLPKLGTEDFIPWLLEETTRRKEAGRVAINKVGVPSREKYMAQKLIELDEATIPDLGQRVQTPNGIKMILFTSFTKAGIPADKQEKLFKIIPAYLRNNLATQLSTLFAIDPAPPPVDSNPQEGGGKASNSPFENPPTKTEPAAIESTG